MITLAVLSWGSHLTLQNTLESYKYYGLDKLVSQKVIYFQELSDKDIEIAVTYGYDIFGSPNNIGIGAAYKELVDYATSDLFLFLENDWELLRDPTKEIITGAAGLYWGMIDVIRLRDRNNPGWPLWSMQFKGKERTSPTHMLDALHWRTDEEMAELKPEIQKLSSGWYKTTSKHANWTNNPTMFRTDWLRENVSPWLVGDVERGIQDWWQDQQFWVAQGSGLFTHNRLDR